MTKSLEIASDEDQFYQPFPLDVQEAIRQDSLMDTPEQTCEEMGGTFDSGKCDREVSVQTEAPTDHPVEATPEPPQEPEETAVP